MGLNDARTLLIEALQSGLYTHEGRSEAEEKNVLGSGVVTRDFVIQLLRRCAGWEYTTSRHHFCDADCHIFTPMLGGERWYIKAYFRGNLAVFVSVHR